MRSASENPRVSVQSVANAIAIQRIGMPSHGEHPVLEKIRNGGFPRRGKARSSKRKEASAAFAGRVRFCPISIGLKIKERNTPRPNRIVEARGGCLATAAASLRLTLKSHQTPHSRIREALLAGFHVTRKPVFKSRVTVNRDDEIVPAIVLMQ